MEAIDRNHKLELDSVSDLDPERDLELDGIGVPRVCRHCPGPSEASSPEPESGAQINRERGRGNIQVQDSAHLASDETKLIVDAFCWQGKIVTNLLLYVFVKFLFLVF